MKFTYPLYIIKMVLSDGRINYDSMPLFGTDEHQLIAFTGRDLAANFYNHPYNQIYIDGIGATSFEILAIEQPELDALIDEMSRSYPTAYLWLDPEMEETGYDYHSGIHVRIRPHSKGKEGDEPDEMVLSQAIDSMKQKITQMQEQIEKWETLLVRITGKR
jgi:hypothetical protein